MLLLGLQHMFAMFGATILVPILVNSYFQSTSQVLSVQVTLFCAGFGTLFSICVPNLRFLLFWDLHLLFWEAFPALRHWIPGYLPIWQIKKTAVCVWRNCCGRIVVSDPCTDHPVRWRKTCDAFPSTGGNRPDHYLYRTEPCTVCGQQCIHKLAHCNCGTGGHHYFNIWGKGMFKIIPILLGVVISYVFALVLQGLGFTNPDGSVILNFPAFPRRLLSDFHRLSCRNLILQRFLSWHRSPLRP